MKIQRLFIPLLLGTTLIFTIGVEGLGAKKKNKKFAQTRTLSGQVFDAKENSVPRAAVRLKNLRTDETRAVYADEDGRYRFTNLKTTVDYEVQAEHNGLVSRARKVTTFDNRKEVVYTLRLSESPGTSP